MAKAGASIVGVNCLFDPSMLLAVMKDMKDALDLYNLKPFLMVQPLGKHMFVLFYNHGVHSV